MRLDEVLAGNYAYLYHGSPIINLLSIFRDGFIHESHNGEEVQNNGIRCSRSMQVALDFTFKQDTWGLNRGGVIVLDAQKLRQKYKLAPHVDHLVAGRGLAALGMKDEAEEIIITRELPLEPFCVALVCAKADIEFIWSEEDYEIASSDYLLPIISYSEYQDMLQTLLDYPKRVETWTRP